MRFSVDAHAIGRHLTGNEVYVRNLLNGFASLDHDAEFITYVSTDSASIWVPSGFRSRRVAARCRRLLGEGGGRREGQRGGQGERPAR